MRKNPGTPGPLGLFYKPLWDLMLSYKSPFVSVWMALYALPVLARAVRCLEAKVLGTMLPRLAGLIALV